MKEGGREGKVLKCGRQRQEVGGPELWVDVPGERVMRELTLVWRASKASERVSVHTHPDTQAGHYWQEPAWMEFLILPG